MKKSELNILKEVINKVAKSNPEAWQSLKWEIWDTGDQSYYHWQMEFLNQANKEINALSVREKDLLKKEWYSLHRILKFNKEEDILERYALMVTDKIAGRARGAAYRTKDLQP
ncbi:MAG: hypothetical protein KKD05_01510 [Candidatus Omnitrophica bacterium]|nr:hypothetical protein [Candidatus Omnitrophota bacterium]